MLDPVADFLARERSVLADISGCRNDLSWSATDEGLPPPAGSSTPETLLPRTPYSFSEGKRNAKESKTEMNDSAFGKAPAVNGTGVHLKVPAKEHHLRRTASATPFSASVPKVMISKIEPEKIKRWREEKKRLIQEKDLEEEKKQKIARQIAKEQLEQWYANQAAELKEAKIVNRRMEEDFIAERDKVEEGADWDRIAKLCDFNVKNSKSATDLSRFRSVIFSLKARRNNV